MIIREAKIEELDKVMAFYEMMCRELASKDFLKKEYKGGFPPLEMVTEAIKHKELFIGEENGAIIAACIMNHESDPAYDAAPWRTARTKSTPLYFTLCECRRNTAAGDTRARCLSTWRKPRVHADSARYGSIA